MRIADQFRRLVELGLAELASTSVEDLRAYADGLPDERDAVLVVHPGVVPPSSLATRLMRENKGGFVVTDMTDLDQFTPIEGVELPQAPLYLIHDLDRGDDMRNWSPAEALTEIIERGRSPLTVNEGISWLLQQPEKLERNHCFMTIASRKPAGPRPDARTPAIWISGGTGRDGKANKNAPKVGWCWAGNRHTWLGFASTSRRSAR